MSRTVEVISRGSSRMKTARQIDDARSTLAMRFLTPGLSESQLALLAGMLNALVWVADGANAETMERILSGEPLAIQDHRNN